MSEVLKGKEVVKAYVKGGGVSETTKGVPQAFVVLQDEHSRDWVWTGSFAELKAGAKTSAREITMKALKSAGFTGSLADLASGKGFEENKEVSVTIDDKWNEDNTKSYRAVDWINGLSKSSILMDQTDSLMKMKGMGLDADFAAMFESKSATPPIVKASDVPF